MKKLKFLSIGFLILVVLLLSNACSHQKVMTNSAKNTAVAESQEAAPEALQIEKHEEVDFSISCLECHAEETPDEVEEWGNSMHGQVNVGCFTCHGDGIEEFYSEPTDERCIACHSDYEVDFRGESEVTSCFSCHSGHSLQFHYHEEAPGFGHLFPQILPRQNG